ncbi:BLUF domain-containing protein [Aurantiacibacter marinus]|uniref:BLUF domain-containing protein n=1 Tax=Aurantiacibacter marinus TaxID=874156 RepID=UPI00069C3554|nr:BLUF domain-containing protein [Aurantiacibacter marinus]
MISLIYVSMASDGVASEDVRELALHSARKNAEHGVTGLLTYNSARFMQLLEGEEHAVMSTMERISLDGRHNDISILRKMDITRRECPDWSMRVLFAPLAAKGSASDFTASLPKQMDVDTRILFTSFASSLRD